MKKILMATDFSAISHNAYLYAYHLSKALDANLQVLYVAPDMNFKNIEASLIQKEKVHFQKVLTNFIQKIPQQYNSENNKLDGVSTIYKFGNVVEEIKKTAEEENSDLILIGTRQKHSLINHLFGSVSTSLIQQINTPLLIIPHQVKFTSIRNIAFADDFELENKLDLSFLKEVVSSLQAKLHHVHVEVRELVPNANEQFDVFYKTSNPLQYIAIVKDKTVKEGLNHFIDKFSIDMLAMMPSSQSNFLQVFQNSETQQMTYHANIPLLILKNT